VIGGPRGKIGKLFGAVYLDLAKACLRGHQKEIPLQLKTFEYFVFTRLAQPSPAWHPPNLYSFSVSWVESFFRLR
jgi:hypothetical protein